MLDRFRVGSLLGSCKQDAWRVVMGMGLMIVLFGALYYNQAHRNLSFVWLSRTLASPASAVLNANLEAKDQKSKFADSVPIAALSSDHHHNGLLVDPLALAPLEQFSEMNTSFDEAALTENSSATSNLASIPPGSTLQSSKLLDQVLEKVNISDANNQKMVVGAPSNTDSDALYSKNSSSLLNEVEKTVTGVATQIAVPSMESPTIALTVDSSTLTTAAIQEQGQDPSLEEKSVHFLSPTPSIRPSKDSEIDLQSSPDVENSSWRFNLELGLKDAKQAIVMAPPVLLDADLYHPLYHNLSSFKKSYEMMEQLFKVYVYDEGEKPMVQTGPMIGIYSSEGQFIQRMVQGNQFTVKDPTRAHVFFLPYSVANMVDKLYVPDSYTMQPINEYVRDYVNMLATRYPFWNDTHGADHFLLSCHDWGLATTFDHKELNKNAMKVLCNADLSDGFILEKDASLPEIYLHSRKLPQRLGGPGPKKRPILAFFAGQMHGRVRPLLIEHWKDKEPDMKIYEVIPSKVARKMSYVQHMKSSKYCICAMGYEVNSPRIVEAIYYDCVPVIIADNFVLPFSDVLNWDAFSLTVPEKDIPNLKQILLNISDQKYQTMQKRLKIVRQHFTWHEQVVRYDVFHMILHSVWNRRLRQVS